MNFKKVLLISVSVIAFVIANVFSSDIDLKERTGLFVVFLLGLHFVYGYVFNIEIHMTGYTVPIGDKLVLRIALFIVGIGIMTGTILYLSAALLV